MIVQNDKGHVSFFNFRISRIHTPQYRCQITTAKEGIFKGLSSVVAEGDAVVDGVRNIRPCVKIIYSKALSVVERHQFHDLLTVIINEGLEAGHTLKDIVPPIIEDWRARGIAAEAINVT